jgi:phosphoheptose isomerase
MLDDNFLNEIDRVGQKLIEATKNRQTIFIAGNGGSWADADHFAGELRAQFELKGRDALPALALPISLSTLTAWGNDYKDGFETAMERDLQAMSRPYDILIAISTSGKAKNIHRILNWSKANHLTSIAISGNGLKSEAFGKMADYHIKIPHDQTARIQEAYQVVIHILCSYIDSIGPKHENKNDN